MNAVSRICNSAVDTANHYLFLLKDMRNDPLAFQKTFQVAYAAIQLGNMHYKTDYLGKFSSVAQAVSMHDFYLIVKEPRDYLFQVNADRIDAPAVLASLETELARQLPQLPGNTPEAIHDFAKTMLQRQLESMANNKDAYRLKEHFLEALQNRVREVGENPHTETLNGYVIPVIGNRANLDLSAVVVDLVPKSKLDRLIHWNWGAVNLLCVTSFFQSWNWLDLSKYAARLGQSPASNWVRNQSLETWLRGGVCTGFLMTFCREAYKLTRTSQPTEAEKCKTKRDALVAFCEVAYQGLGLFNHMKILPVGAGIIHLAAFITKAIGIWVLVENSKFKPNYFRNPAAV